MNQNPIHLAGDIGGTKTRIALFHTENGHLVQDETETFSSQDAPDFPTLLQQFLDRHPAHVDSACFGAPGPVFQGEVEPTNLEWTIREQDIQRLLKINRVKLVNDLVATAAAIPHLRPDQVLSLYDGKDHPAPEMRYVVLAPGTGLGQAFLVVRQGQPFLFPSEGGHADFSPTSELEIDLLRFLQTKFPRVSWERVLSGPGTENIYDFLLQRGDHGAELPELTRRFQHEPRAKVISEYALSGEHQICVATLDLFVRLLGVHAGNLALTFRANGGVFLGGGIPPKIKDRLKSGKTVEAFLGKERMAAVVERFPLRVILDDHAAILGAAAIAARLNN